MPIPGFSDLLPTLARWMLENTSLSEVMRMASRLLHRVFRRSIYSAAYEVIDHDVRLELHDAEGKRATYFKRQKVRFLQDNVIAFQDQAWGDGDIFEDYQCSPGIPVDRYREAYRYRILISLRETKNYGDVEEFHIVRKIRNGFVGDVQDFQTQIDHRTDLMIMTVIFPKVRHPKEVWLLERNSTKSTPLDSAHLTALPDGRLQARWTTQKPRLFEAYSLRWKW